MNNHYMIFYRLIDGIYEPVKFGSNIVPTENIDKVIQVPEEVSHQAFKFDFDGTTLKRREGEYVMTLEEYKEFELQSERDTFGGSNPYQYEVEKQNEINIEI